MNMIPVPGMLLYAYILIAGAPTTTSLQRENNHHNGKIKGESFTS